MHFLYRKLVYNKLGLKWQKKLKKTHGCRDFPKKIFVQYIKF